MALALRPDFPRTKLAGQRAGICPAILSLRSTELFELGRCNFAAKAEVFALVERRWIRRILTTWKATRMTATAFKNQRSRGDS